jgi:hypothetical protein
MFDWREYLELANDLGTASIGSTITLRSSEATDRCAVSRAYYAAFCHARNYAAANLNFVPTNRGSDHWMLQQHFNGIGMSPVARTLRRLHGWRKQCDYEDTLPNLSTIVSRALAEAAAVIGQL